jgi:hypothetical protein
MIIALAIPPPSHMVCRPYLPPVASGMGAVSMLAQTLKRGAGTDGLVGALLADRAIGPGHDDRDDLAVEPPVGQRPRGPLVRTPDSAPPGLPLPDGSRTASTITAELTSRLS